MLFRSPYDLRINSLNVCTIVNAQDAPAIVQTFKELILKSYGEKSLDGKRFEKSLEKADAFAQTEAYSELFMELATNTDSAIKFCNGIMPKTVH